jgi:hypothetical protein
MQEDLFTIMQKSSQRLQDMFIFSTKSYRGFGTYYLTPYLPLSMKWRGGLRGRGFQNVKELIRSG